MPEVYRAFQVHFAKAEIEEILRERAKALVLTRKDQEKLDVATVRHVEGEAIVNLIIGPPKMIDDLQTKGVRR
ncbi:hypothetical protein BSZ19_18625 [Bradyrhizobium japonicum]|uniref:Uncharacterized protein n=1 Tax=Bradyrhizobium japonicum TaxID=375 RepID=A0A1Y2JRH1_BRAJP|nr:hypothetical protein [Bradyrhizobium japonicum]OSJ32566.1 hypothetical protein BSZ19_18625 [Bradyrhizobium japonicum]